MNTCFSFRSLLALHAGGDTDPKETVRVEAHLAGCAPCREEAVHMSTALVSARQAFVNEYQLPSGVRARIATEAAEKIRRGGWAGALFSFAPRRAFLAPAVALAALAVLSLAVWTEGHRTKPHEAGISRFEVMAGPDGTVRLAWSNGERPSYTIYRTTDPRGFGRAEAHVVKGNIWVDDERDASRVVYYRVE
jgi:hypothetical protein